KQGNRTGHERKAQEAFPVGAGGHGILRNATDNQLDSICKSAFKASRARNLVVRLIGSGARTLLLRLCCGALGAAGLRKPEHLPDLATMNARKTQRERASAHGPIAGIRLE